MKRTSTEAHVYMRRHQGTKVKHFGVSNVIYCKFLNGAVSYTLIGETINVMLEYRMNFLVGISSLCVFVGWLFEIYRPFETVFQTKSGRLLKRENEKRKDR